MRSEDPPPPLDSAPVGGPPLAPVPFRVRERAEETADTATIGLEALTGDRTPEFAPGQFNMLYALGVGEVAISISGDPARTNRLAHTVRAVGKVSSALARARPGDVIGVRGPYGAGWPMGEAHGRDVIVVAGGSGFASLRAVLYELLAHRDRFGRVEVVYGARSPPEILYRSELADWRRRSDARVQVTVDAAGRDWYGDVGVVTTRLPDTRFEPDRAIAFLCGPEIMMRKTAEALERRGVPDAAIWVSMERNMKCAVGQCGHCQLGPAFVCRDGPVFRYDRIRPFLSVREL